MFRYRITALVLPVMLLAFLPTLAASQWHMPLGDGLAFPFLTVLVVLICALRYPGLLPSPLVFCSGLACDLFTRSPLGYWTLVMLITLALARFAETFHEHHGRLVRAVSTVLLPAFITLIAWILASLYELSWQPVRTTIEGMLMALLLLIVPVLLLMGLETLLITKKQNDPSRTFRRSRY
ncbi:MAG: hypothetical protein L3J67_02805 [Hyphomicrobiaceae bacterium]|nr:hypothetical protein [Hyphomicrobiaceae bacterium]